MSIEIARRVLAIEAEAVQDLIEKVGPSFEEAEQIIFKASGRVILSGLGKSGLIARKIAATFSSIGIPAFFLHPVEGAHGDIGMVMKGDVAIVISKSGVTDELNDILNHLKHLQIPVVAMTGNLSSNLAKFADVALDVSVTREACPFDIVPTASTTAALAMGDALAMSLLERKGLTANDFALFHPGGSIGRKLTYRVSDLMVNREILPIMDIDSPMRDVIAGMTAGNLGIAILTEKNVLAGVITDGDLRRLLERVERPLELTARESLEHTSRKQNTKTPPITIKPDDYVIRAVNLMEKHVITAIVVTGAQGEPVGLIRWIDLSCAGVI